jgi:hypothetical protein
MFSRDDNLRFKKKEADLIAKMSATRSVVPTGVINKRQTKKNPFE